MNSNAREIWLHWEQPVPGDNDKAERGGVRMTLGAMKYLGIKGEDMGIGTTTYEQGQKTFARAQWAGGPKVPYTRKQLTVVRIMSGSVSTAKSGDVMYLVGDDGTQDTIRVTGNKRAFAQWLKSKTNMGLTTDTVVLKSKKGRTYAVLHNSPTDIVTTSTPTHATI